MRKNNKKRCRGEDGSQAEFSGIMGDLITGDFQNPFKCSPKLLKLPLCLDNVFLFFTDGIL